MGKWPFLAATAALLVAVSAGIYLGGHGLFDSYAYWVQAGIVAQLMLILFREAAIKQRFRWRFAYALVPALLAVLAIDLIWAPPQTPNPEVYVSEAVMVYFWSYYILLVPVFLCSLAKDRPTPKQPFESLEAGDSEQLV